MKQKELLDFSISTLSNKIKNKEISPVELTKSVLKRIKESDEKINAYITVMDTESLATAEKAEEEINKGNYRGPLHGIPLSVKDNIDVIGTPTTNGSQIHKNYFPNSNARVINLLLGAGMIPIGKTNLHEYAYGITTNNPFFGPTRNPYNTDKIPGGSSGGSAAAIATKSAIASVGTDTAGSVRIPAACCGTVGLKPTYGRVSREGVFPLSWSLDHVGPMTKSVIDASLMLEAMSEYEYRFQLSQNSHNLEGLVIGVPEKEIFYQIDPSVKKGVNKTIELLRTLNAKIQPITINSFATVPTASMATFAPEASTVHYQQLLERPEAFSPDVRNYLKFGQTVTGVQYLQGQQLRRLIVEELNHLFKEVDAILLPTIPTPAPDIGQSHVQLEGVEWGIVDAMERFTSLANVSGFPALAMPSGLTPDGLPVGIQLMGNKFDEQTLIQIGTRLEENSNIKAL